MTPVTGSHPDNCLKSCNNILTGQTDPSITAKKVAQYSFQITLTNRQDKQIPEEDEEEVATVDEIEAVAAEPETDRSPASNLKFVYHPYFGFVPAKAIAKNDKKTFVYDPYYGFVPSKPDEKATAEDDKIEYYYDPLYGYMPVTDSKKKMKTEEKKYVLHSYFGFVPESQAEDIGISADTAKWYVYSPYYGFVPAKDEDEAEDDTKEVNVEEVDVGTRIKLTDLVKDEEQEEVNVNVNVDVDTKEAREKYYYHPYNGFVKVDDGKEVETIKFLYDPLYGYFPEMASKDEDGKERKKFMFSPYYGYVPVKKSNRTEEKEDSKPQPEFYYNEKHGFVPVRGKGDDETEFYLDPFNGYLPVTDKSRNEIAPRQFVYSAYYGFIPATTDGKKPKVPNSPYNVPFRSGYNPYYYPYNNINPYYSPEIDLVSFCDPKFQVLIFDCTSTYINVLRLLVQ